MAERFTDYLRHVVEPIWAAQHRHPFVRGIGDGTLDMDKFRYWVRQDYLYLIDYARVFALGTARAPDLATMTAFANLVHVTLETEMDLHRSYAAEFGITLAELEREQKAPTTRAYTDFLLRVAALGDFGELAAGLLPCMWGFCEIGQRLAERERPADARYAQWIDMYSNAEFAELTTWCRALVDRLAEGTSSEARQRIEDAFVTSSRHELAFWQMAWTLERWPDQAPPHPRG